MKESGRDVAVFVVWQPVLDTDWDPPDESARSRVKAIHFWDPKKRVAAAVREPFTRRLDRFNGKARLLTGPDVWDVVAVFPPEAAWESAPPAPAFLGAPVVEIRARLLSSLL